MGFHDNSYPFAGNDEGYPEEKDPSPYDGDMPDEADDLPELDDEDDDENEDDMEELDFDDDEDDEEEDELLGGVGADE